MADKKIWDLIVIGGGPAGMMAAGRAAELGAKVLLIEKNNSLGKKLLITGGGRCNLTNYEPDSRKFLSKFKGRGKFLFSAFAQFGVEQSLDFFHRRGLETKVEAGGRVFPKSNKAESVFQILADYLKQNKVSVFAGNPVKDFLVENNRLVGVLLANKQKIYARSVALATGGKSRPETGSTGDGFIWLKKLGHAVTAPDPSLVPLAIKDGWIKELQGITLEEVKITVLQNQIKQLKKSGRILFTHFGVSGPTIINLSKDVGELLKYGKVFISLDLFPALGHGELNSELQKLISENLNKKFQNIFKNFLPAAALSPLIIRLADLNPDTFCHSLKREERLTLVGLLKNLSMEVQNLLGADKAIVTSGGVSPTEVDFKNMNSRLFPNLYLVGDILDIDRPSGGYSLQLCWTTGFVAGSAAARDK